MKLTVILLILSCMQLSAKGFGQTLTLHLKNASLEQVFKEIEKQTGYSFVYGKEQLLNSKPVNLTISNADLETVLNLVFKGQTLTYVITGKFIAIKLKVIPMPKMMGFIQEPPPLKITGKITDEYGKALQGASVQVKGTSLGTSSDVNGQFEIDVPDNSSKILIFSFIGMEQQEVNIAGKTKINIVLHNKISQQQEVVVVGYGTQKKINLTGAVDVVSGDRLENRPAANVADLIKGTSPNLNITMNMRGGEPGAVSNWNIRGMGSIQGDASPLVLVDGVEMNLSDIDPESVESVSVLKDASASAIYGSRAPFGVILITTKRGGKAEKVRIQYTNNLSLVSPLKVPSFVDALTWATAYNQANANAGLNPVYADEQMERIKGYMAGTYKTEYDPNNPIISVFGGRRSGNANYDWPQILYKDYSFSQKHNVNISGGNANTQYYISGGYADQDGLYAYGYDFYKRYNFLTNFSSKVTKWLSFNSSVKYAKGKTDYPIGMTTVGRDYTFGEFITWAPMTPMYNINGTIQSSMIRLLQGSGRDKTENNDFILSLGSEIEPIKGWKTNFSYNHNYIGSRNTTNPKPVMVEMGDGSFGNIGKPTSGYSSLYAQNSYTLANLVTSYEFTINGHYFKPLLGYEQEDALYTNMTGTGTNLITDEIPSLSTALGVKTVDDRLDHWATQGIFGRLNYNYKEKYLFEFSARYNGSSRFAKESRWGFFPSASVGYNVSSENFWSPLKSYINLFKLRGSYGSLGNQNVSSYLYLSTIPVANEANWIIDQARPPYASVPALISDNLTWETVTTLNLGIDAALLSNRLTVSFDWYDRKTTNMLGPSITLPYILGAATPPSNNAELSTKGFELLLGWEDRISKDLSYNVKIGLGDSKSTILKYENEKGLIDTWYKGKNVGEIWGFETDGLIQSTGEKIPDQSKYYAKWGPGDMKYKDLTGDGIINDGTRTINDHGDLVVIGNNSPRYNIGITAGLNWKGFDFSMFWQGIAKRNYYPHTAATLFFGMNSGFGSSGILKGSPALDYWRPADETNILGPNTDAYFARPYFTAETNKNRQVQSRYVLNAAYLRLKSIHLGYTLPERISNKFLVQKARIYISGENLLTLSGLPKVFDPETVFAANLSSNVPGVVYPISSSVSFGVNLTF